MTTTLNNLFLITMLVLISIIASTTDCWAAMAPDAVEKTTYTHDKQGRLLKMVSESGEKASTTTFDYTTDGLLSEKNIAHKDGRREKVTFTYDEGNLVEERFEGDQDGNGVADARSVTRMSYGPNGLTTKVTDSDTDGDGSFDESTTVTFHYSSNGEMVKEVVERDLDLDQSPDERYVIVMDYDTGQLASKVIEHDLDADGKTDRREKVLFDYDASGKLASERIETVNQGKTDLRVIAHDVSDEVVGGGDFFLSRRALVLIAVNLALASCLGGYYLYRQRHP